MDELALLKADLGFFGSQLPAELESYLSSLLTTAATELRERCGLDLCGGNDADAELIAMYAAWLYRNRATGAGKTPMLRSSIRDRQVDQALKTPEAGT